MSLLTISALGSVALSTDAASEVSDKANQFKEILPMGERLSLAVQVLVVGMATVFSVLILLWAVLKIFKIFSYDIPEKRKKKNSTNASTVTTVETAETGVDDTASDDTELIAVITAAIEAYNSDDPDALPFRVVSYKRIKGANGWNRRQNETL